ncbi:MAG: PilZ domain-containing protein [Rhodanobacteraceae bacterium]
MQKDKMRHARMKIESAAWISHGSEAWSCVLEDISATGVRVRRPDGWRGKVGDHVSMDMLVGDSLNIHVQAVVARISGDSVGFAYDRIPPDKEVPLWNLLGGYADTLEPWDED